MNVLEPLWEIEDELAALIDSVDTCPDDLKPELEARIAQYLGHEIEKVDRIAHVLFSYENVVAAAKTEIERLRQRQQAAQKRAERLEQYVLRVIEQHGGKPLKGRNVTFSVRHSESLVILDPQLVPEEFKRTTVTIDIPKDPLKKAIKAGEEIPGATIQYGEHLVRK